MRKSSKKALRILPFTAVLFAASAAMAGSPMIYPEPEIYMPMEPDPLWEGFYAGAIGGFQTGDLIETTIPTTLPFDATTFGGMAGYNFQKDKLVVGAELDVQIGAGSTEAPRPLVNNFGGFGPIDLDVNYLVDLRGRVGMAFDNVLVYGAAGYTATKISQAAWELAASGFNVGAGIDLAVKEDFFVGGEYIYRDLSGQDNLSNPWDLNTHGFQIRAGYRF